MDFENIYKMNEDWNADPEKAKALRKDKAQEICHRIFNDLETLTNYITGTGLEGELGNMIEDFDIFMKEVWAS